MSRNSSIQPLRFHARIMLPAVLVIGCAAGDEASEDRVYNPDEEIGPADGAGSGANASTITSPSVPAHDSRPVSVRSDTFDISPNSQICITDAQIHPNLKVVAPSFAGISITGIYQALGQPDHLESIGRGGGQLGPKCPDNGINQVLTWSLLPNASGEPYFLGLELRQGERVWFQTIERAPQQLNPDRFYQNALHGEPVPEQVKIKGSIMADKRVLEKRLIEHLKK